MSETQEEEKVLIVLEGLFDFGPRVKILEHRSNLVRAYLLEVIFSLLDIIADYVLIDNACYVEQLESDGEAQVNVEPGVVCVP